MTDRKTTDTEDKGQSTKGLAQALGKLIALALVVILVLLVEHYCTYKPPAFGPVAKITAIDGDTLRAGNGDQYRIFGIDAPELHQACKDASGKSWLCGRAAKAKLTKAGGVNCATHSSNHYGRTAAICSARGGSRSRRGDGPQRLRHRSRRGGRQSLSVSGNRCEARHLARDFRPPVGLAPGPSSRGLSGAGA